MFALLFCVIDTREEEEGGVGKRGVEDTQCPGEAGMAGAALCVCTCMMGCSWVVGKQYSSQRYLT